MDLETMAPMRLRVRPEVRWNRVPQVMVPAWSRFLGDAGARWQASWDRATNVPSRLFGQGLAAPGAVRDPSAAARHARAFLARHIDLLAPGSAPSDFVLVSNQVHHGLRTVGFVQRAGGVPVLGGQVSFRYKNDRLFVIASQALPHVVVPAAAGIRADLGAARAMAASWLLADGATRARAGSVTGPYILPLVGPGGVRGYRRVDRVDVSTTGPLRRYWVYTDAVAGVPVARRQRLMFAEGTVQFNVPMRYPGAARQDFPARRASFTVNGAPAESDEAGLITWDGTAAGNLLADAVGPLVNVDNQAGQPASKPFVIQPGGMATWDARDDELTAAQLSAFIHASIVKAWARANLAPDLAWLDTQMPVHVNIDDQCNAYSDGDSLNFFKSSATCQNTARIADVVYHEFGHSLHAHSLIDGVGSFDPSHSEGLADYLAASITGDTGMGRGFFYSDEPLREIDPPDYEYSWPRDVGEVHDTGMIFSGAMWDLRKLLIKSHGQDDGIALANRLFYSTLQRANGIPSTYVEILAEDDDDGDLSNGTPDVCDIDAAFGAHGLRGVSAQLEPLTVEAAEEESYPVTLHVDGLHTQCPGDGVAAAHIEWKLRGKDDSSSQKVDMAAGGADATGSIWSGDIPSVDDDQVVRFKVVVDFLDGSSHSFPDNQADPRYEFYVGETKPIYCTDFESDPFAPEDGDQGGWTHQAVAGKDDWAWGMPMAPSAAGDPPAALSGDSVIGNDLGQDGSDGSYEHDQDDFVLSPIIDVGRYSDVRVQYWRWLTTEDAFFDKATIYANGQQAWRNLDSDQGDQSSTQHLDHEWRFQDVPVSDFITDGTLQLKFEQSSDGGLEFGGWNIDDLCVVAAAGAVCGDGALAGSETCDDGDGNSDTEADACRSNCRVAHCGDGVRDSGESCDDGNVVDGDGCNSTCTVGANEGDCGCVVAPRRGSGPSGAGGLAVLVLGGLFLWRRGRRRRA